MARNPAILLRDLQKTSPDPVEAAPAVGLGLLVDVVVLSNDNALFEAARAAMGERNPVWRARSADEAADLLITGRCGVLLIDMGAVSTRADSLLAQITEQFPDVVICVAGERDDEPLLVPLISDGLVYRFMHKPVTARRAGMFLQAATRHHLDRREGLGAQDPLRPLLRRLAHPPAALKGALLATLLAAVAVVTSYLAPAFRDRSPTDATSAMAAQHDPALRANPVLSRARAALAAERYETPAGRNSLDLFKAVLLEHPGHAEARAGLETSITKVLERARAASTGGNRDEADRLVRRVLSADPQRQQALLLARELNPPDTPSRHLDREQIDAARLAAQAVAPVAAMQSSARRAAPVAAAAPPAQPRAAIPTRAAPALTAQAPPPGTRQPVRVMPDPLAPRYTNAAAYRAAAGGKRVARDYGAPISPQPEIAGLAREPASPAAWAPLTPAPEERAARPFVAADELDRIEARDPVYPVQALRNKTHGSVDLEFTITEAGSVSDIAVLDARPSGVFERAATEALATWRFRPRYVNGQPVVHRSSVTMHFAVDD